MNTAKKTMSLFVSPQSGVVAQCSTEDGRSVMKVVRVGASASVAGDSLQGSIPIDAVGSKCHPTTTTLCGPTSVEQIEFMQRRQIIEDHTECSNLLMMAEEKEREYFALKQRYQRELSEHERPPPAKARRIEDRRHNTSSLSYVAQEHFSFQNQQLASDQWSQLLSRARYGSFNAECRDVFLNLLDPGETLEEVSLQEERSLVSLLCHCLRNNVPHLAAEEWNALLDKVLRRCVCSTEIFHLWWAHPLCDLQVSLACALSQIHTGRADAAACRLIGALYRVASSSPTLAEAMEHMTPVKFDHQLLLALCVIIDGKGTESCDDEQLCRGIRILLLLAARMQAGSVRFGPQCDHWVVIRVLSRIHERKVWLEQTLHLSIKKAEELLTSVLHPDVV